MTEDPSHTALALPSERDTARFGAALAALLAPGDTVLLRGPLGAGKSVLARAVIRALMDDPEAEIPSPSYTLVNIYETPRGAVWHADLYRLSGEVDEIEELGLGEAMGTALVLVEWPERLGAALPARRIEVQMTAGTRPDERHAEVMLVGPDWEAVARMLAKWT
ncbi:MAG TPA: tRNA (adenosine(37)-N6)-threonylcarbamoyltransferase complex ATPase subunit type 1 TsaE [Thermohalobaculum sp.]|nr:tRNA (adenosine(37)-N6)-threonylcarbamoyltransferase complex ATPase subunit type 1 TsaE [Thermohalobaculum sp.]